MLCTICICTSNVIVVLNTVEWVILASIKCKMVASSPGHSHVFNITRVTLKTWEWPGDEASEMALHWYW